MPQTIIDSHIHLWPASAANQTAHEWMTPNFHLAKQYSVENYKAAITHAGRSDAFHVAGFVYIETARKIGPGDAVASWAAEPLREMAFLRRLVEGEVAHGGGGEGFARDDGRLLRGIVAWAPLDRGVAALREYLAAAEAAAGAATWARVRGIRFLLQWILDEGRFRGLVEDEAVVDVLREIAAKGWAFDVGVDQRQGGVWQLELAADLMGRVRSGGMGGAKGVFVLSEYFSMIDTILWDSLEPYDGTPFKASADSTEDHLCKPDMHQIPETATQKDEFDRWKKCIQRMSSFENVYMKLSGGFSELPKQSPVEPWPIDAIIDRVMPWVQHVLECFTPQRIMFGSDWPVCNVVGPGDSKTWGHWRDVVAEILERAKFSEAEKDRIWFGTAVEAYSLEFKE